MSSIIGKWNADPSDPETARLYGASSVEFGADGRMTYTIHAGKADKLIFLTYRIEGDEIVSDQPSAPKESRSRFSFTEDGKLAVFSEGKRIFYVRAAAK